MPGLKVQNGVLYIYNPSEDMAADLKTLGKMKWVRDDNVGRNVLAGAADLERLDKVAWILGQGGLALPPSVEKLRRKLRATRDAVDRERANPKPAPMTPYPVRLPLYAHQIRGANMCLLTFGWTPPEGVQDSGVLE